LVFLFPGLEFVRKAYTCFRRVSGGGRSCPSLCPEHLYRKFDAFVRAFPLLLETCIPVKVGGPSSLFFPLRYRCSPPSFSIPYFPFSSHLMYSLFPPGSSFFFFAAAPNFFLLCECGAQHSASSLVFETNAHRPSSRPQAVDSMRDPGPRCDNPLPLLSPSFMKVLDNLRVLLSFSL